MKTMKTKQKKEKRIITKKEKIFMIANSILIVAILGTYLGRAIYYALYFEKIYSSYTYTTLQQVLKNGIDLLEEENGLFENEDGSYSFRNQPTNNYCIFSNTLYRIMGISADGTIRLVSDEPVSLGTLYEGESFENTDLFKWLNKTNEDYSGIFEETIEMQTGLLTDVEVCYVSVDDLSDIQCEKSQQPEEKVTILSIADYLDAGGADSYLNNGSSFWLCNQDAKGNYYYVDEDGALGVQVSKAMAEGIRPVIELNFTVSATGGSGTAEDPYILKEFTAAKVSETLAGDYIQYGDYLFRVNNIENDGVVLIMDGLINENGNTVVMKFGTSNTFTVDNGVGMYLNTTFLNTLPNYENILTEHDYCYGEYGGFDDYSYLNSFENTYHCYVGIPNASFLYLNGYDGYFIAMQSYQSKNLIYTIQDGHLYADYLNETNAIRPVICMNRDLQIVSGEGTKEAPYQINVETEVTNNGQ